MRDWTLVCCIVALMIPMGLSAQSAHAEVHVSTIIREGAVMLYQPGFLVNPGHGPHDTFYLRFSLVNDTDRDTTLYLLEDLNDWVLFSLVPENPSRNVYLTQSGRHAYELEIYESIHYPARPFEVHAGERYRVMIGVKGVTYRPAQTQIAFLSPWMYKQEFREQLRYEYTNFIITYFFVGSLAFGFFFFLFLYSRSKYHLFGYYALFLFIQVLYGIIQFDVYTGIGSFMRTRADWDDYVNEILVFIGQALYVHFMALWMDTKSENRRVHNLLNGLGIFFLVYAIVFFIMYKINPLWPGLYQMEKWIRLSAVVIQLALYYIIIFHVKSPVKIYVLVGTSFVVLFGVGFVEMARAGWFRETWVYNFDYGSWYMIGIWCECMCFASGLGLRYLQMHRSNLTLQAENIRALEGKLALEKTAREHESKLAEVNQELTNQQLTALRAQMNPHFIFNALNSIQKYIVTGSVDEANSYLSKFSRLQRMILSYSDANFITLDKEIEILRLYLELEQLRLTNEFHFTIDVDEEIEPEEIRMPPMILQPFAENAIWHGLIPKQGEKRLAISFAIGDSDTLHCIVEDNGIGRKAAQQIKAEKTTDKTVNKSKGMSLVHNRLVLLESKYGKPFKVRIVDKMNGEVAQGTRVEIEVPVMD
jgi:two-component sensor histidine kinase